MYYYRLISSMLKAVISTLGTGLYAVYKATSILTTLNTNIFGVYNGDNVNDTSGNALNGTNVGSVTFTTGKIGNAFTFNGSNYVALPNSSFDFHGDFSISAWVKIPSAPTSTAYIFQNDNYDVVTSYGYGLYVKTNKEIGFYVGSIIGASTVTSTTVLALNTWYHVTIKRDSVAKRSDLYINGVFEAQATNTNITIGYGTRAIQPTIGAYRGNNQGVLIVSNYLNGSVDALTIWNKKLSDYEVMALYNGSTGLEYPFSTAITIDSANDSLGNYNGTPYGGLTYTAGKSGNAFTFNGTTGYVGLGINNFKFSNNFTISLWFNVNTSDGILFSNFHNDGSGAYGYFLYKTGSNLRWQIYSSGDNNNKTVAIPGYATSTWFHVLVVASDSTAVGGFSNGIYIDGILAGYNSYATNIRYSPTINHYPTIGAMYYGEPPALSIAFNGKIDEVGIWNRKLTSAEVTELYNAGTGKFYPY